ncbi:MAG TPA: hypothetical protein VEP50_12215 [bacterium]|nr:hypothetical protein [bacterium]
MEDAPQDAALDSERRFLRHCVATLAYRAAKTIRGAPEGFAEFRISGATRTPGEIVRHLGDLIEWALSMAQGVEARRSAGTGLPWPREVARFFEALRSFDAHLASDAPLRAPAARLFQGPVADALTHVGQLATRRSLAGSPVRGENYFVADIAVGRVGPEQAPPRREFD